MAWRISAILWISLSKTPMVGGIGEHEGGGVLVDEALEFGEVDHSLGVRLEVLDLVAADGGCGGVGAVGRVGDENLLAGVALALVVSADEEDAGELTVGSGGGLEGDGVHAGDLDETVLQGLHNLQRALGEAFGLVGVSVGKTLEAGDGFVHARVVLHGAASERIHAEVDGVIPGGEPGEVADDLDLGELGHDAEARALRFAEEGAGVDGGDVEFGEAIGLLAGRRLLKDEVFVLVNVGRDLLRCSLELRFSQLCNLCHRVCRPS